MNWIKGLALKSPVNTLQPVSTMEQIMNANAMPGLWVKIVIKMSALAPKQTLAKTVPSATTKAVAILALANWVSKVRIVRPTFALAPPKSHARTPPNAITLGDQITNAFAQPALMARIARKIFAHARLKNHAETALVVPTSESKTTNALARKGLPVRIAKRTSIHAW